MNREQLRLIKYIKAAVNLYGAIHLDDLINLLNYYDLKDVSNSILKATIKNYNSLDKLNSIGLKNNLVAGNLFALSNKDSYDAALSLVELRDVMPRYTPAKETFLKCQDYNYISPRAPFNRLVNFIFNNLVATSHQLDLAEHYAYNLRETYLMTQSLEEVLIEAISYKLNFMDKTTSNLFIDILESLFEETRLYGNLGFTNKELTQIFEVKSTILFKFVKASVNLYGVITLDGLIEVLNHYHIDFVNSNFLIKFIDNIASNKLDEQIRTKDNIITNAFFNFDNFKNEQTIKRLLKDQQNVSRYYPLKEEFLLYKSAYSHNLNIHFNLFKDFLISAGYFSNLSEKEILKKIQEEIFKIKLGHNALSFLTTIIDSLDKVLSVEQINKLSANYVKLISTIRHYHLNGHTLEEINNNYNNFN